MVEQGPGDNKDLKSAAVFSNCLVFVRTGLGNRTDIGNVLSGTFAIGRRNNVKDP
jgi:hypothetical protein